MCKDLTGFLFTTADLILAWTMRTTMHFLTETCQVWVLHQLRERYRDAAANDPLNCFFSHTFRFSGYPAVWVELDHFAAIRESGLEGLPTQGAALNERDHLIEDPFPMINLAGYNDGRSKRRLIGLCTEPEYIVLFRFPNRTDYHLSSAGQHI